MSSEGLFADAQYQMVRPRREVPGGPMREAGEEGLYSAELVRASAGDREGRRENLHKVMKSAV
eukprot:8830598-Pyramimonas_sp.AAC.1